MSEVAFAVSDILNNSEILDCCTLSIAKLKAKFAEQAKLRGFAETKKEGEAMFEQTVAGMLTEKEPRRVIYRSKEGEA